MKKLLVVLTLFTTAAHAGSYIANEIVDTNGPRGMENALYISTVSMAGSTTAIFAPTAGLIIVADGEASLNLEKTLIQEKIEEIQMALEFGDELTEQQEAILNVGIDAGQLDGYGNIIL